MSDLHEMIERAAKARNNAHAPYSKFKVGACIKCDDGRFFVGCNVENIAYPQGLCAEAGAIAAMVAAGGGRKITEVVIVAEGDKPCTPCGGCRQKLAEFAEAATVVHVGGPDDNSPKASYTLGELLPHGFDFAPDTP